MISNEEAQARMAKQVLEEQERDRAFWDAFAERVSNKMHWDDQSVSTLLTSSLSEQRRNRGLGFRLFVDALNDGCFDVSVTPLPKTQGHIPPIFLKGGGIEHSHLKWVGALWLRNKFPRARIVSEVSYCSMRIDVAALKENAFVECGDVSSDKVIDILEPPQNQLLLIPFSYSRQIGFVLTATERGRLTFYPARKQRDTATSFEVQRGLI